MHFFQIFLTKIFLLILTRHEKNKNQFFIYLKKNYLLSLLEETIARRNLLDRDLNLKLTKSDCLIDVFLFFFFFFFFSSFTFFFFFFSKKNSSSSSNFDSNSIFEFDSRSRFSREEFFARFFLFVEERESIVMRTRERF